MTQHRQPIDKNAKILLIDDEGEWLEGIRQVLAQEPYSIVTADSAEAALKKLKGTVPDLILSDVRMPVMNGFELYEKVRNDPALKDVPYVFMSVIDDYEAMRTAKKLGAEEYIIKPYSAEEAKQILLDLLLRYRKK